MTLLPNTNPHEPSLRVESLHALKYCERLFYFQEVERLEVPHAAVFAGRELHESIDAEQGDMVEAVEVESAKLGLHGKIDVLKRRDGTWIPYDHKRGRCMRGSASGQPKREDSDVAQAWPSDRIQLAAYAMMLEEAFGQSIREARVRYHADNLTVRIPIDDYARQNVVDAVSRARQLRQSTQRPPIAENEKLCARCSLAPVCLPEETRHELDVSHVPLRLFPETETRTTLHVLADGAKIGRSAESLVVTPREGEGEPVKHPAHQIGSLLLHGFSQITTQAIRLCVDRDITVHWLTAGGDVVGSLQPGAGGVHRRIRQYQALVQPEICLRLARQLAAARVQTQHGYVLRATRGSDDSRSEVERHLRDISDALGAISRAASIDSIRGHEGDAGRHYFACFNHLLSEQVHADLRYAGRSRRPTTDRISALLNFGYSLLHTAVMRAILAVGLEPAFGFFHQPRSAAHPLVLDMMELFRVPLVDMAVVASLNRGQWDPQSDFSITKTRTWLSPEGKKKMIGLFEFRLQEVWKHPIVQYSLSYARTIELETRLLEKEWSGEPGMFGKSRLR